MAQAIYQVYNSREPDECLVGIVFVCHLCHNYLANVHIQLAIYQREYQR